MEEYKGREVYTSIKAFQNERGWWEVRQHIVQRRSKDLKEWEEKDISASAISETLDTAQSRCSLTMIMYLKSVDGDLFNDSNLLEEKEKVQ